MRGHCHDGAGAIVANHEVGDPDRHPFLRERVDRKPPGKETLFLDRAADAPDAVLRPKAVGLRAHRLRVGRLEGERLHQRVLGAEGHEGGAEDRVDSRGEHVHGPRTARLIGLDNRKPEPRALAAPDPVPLHRQHFVGPRAQAAKALEQLVGVRRDPEEPLFELTRRDHRAAPPAAAIDDLLVGKHGLAALAPVHRRLAAIREPALVHADEEPLVPVVVLGGTGRDLAIPRVAYAEPLKLALHVLDVVERRHLGINAALDGGVLGGQAEGIPPERVQDVVAAHPPRSGDHVADDVIADMADVRVPGRVREHLEAIELRLRGVFRRLEHALGQPTPLPFLVEVAWIVVGHAQL